MPLSNRLLKLLILNKRPVNLDTVYRPLRFTPRASTPSIAFANALPTRDTAFSILAQTKTRAILLCPSGTVQIGSNVLVAALQIADALLPLLLQHLNVGFALGIACRIAAVFVHAQIHAF